MNVKMLVAVFAITCVMQSGTSAERVRWEMANRGNGHWYEVLLGPHGTSGSITWRAASLEAQSRGGYLATITSGEENAFVFDVIDEPAYWVKSVNWRGPWIGGMQLPGSTEPAGGWVWVTGEPFIYSNWDAGQPNEFDGNNENRIHYGNQPTYVPFWNDVPMDFAEINSYVVEYVPEPSSVSFSIAILVALCSWRWRSIRFRNSLGNFVVDPSSGDQPCRFSYVPFRVGRSILCTSFTLAWTTVAVSGEYYISTIGSNTGSGAVDSPWATFDYAISRAKAGDMLFVRGGTYNLDSTIVIKKSGAPGTPISILAYPGETPVLDLASDSWSYDSGIQVDGDWWHLKGLTVQNAPLTGVWVSGSNNVFEQLVLRRNGDSGLQLTGNYLRQPSNNLILNTDSYENYDAPYHGENADGFAAKWRYLGPGNVFRGNRAWGNSDDGWDFWAAGAGIILENNWSFRNGVNTWGDSSFAGDGNGFKLGHDGGTHSLVGNLAWSNLGNGFDVNGNATPDPSISPPDVPHGVTLYNNTALSNRNRNYRFDEAFPHVLRNNVSFKGSNTVYGSVDDQYNSWTTIARGTELPPDSWSGVSVDASDFMSLDDSGATGPRQADGGLPRIDFLRLASGSDLIDAGIDVGLVYSGSAPDLGAYERTVPEPAAATVALIGFGVSLVRRVHHGRRKLGWERKRETGKWEGS